MVIGMLVVGQEGDVLFAGALTVTGSPLTPSSKIWTRVRDGSRCASLELTPYADSRHWIATVTSIGGERPERA